ncbi:hypothetical protein [Nocardioides deserti]|uniref:Uncharacterized protein n=1 Tax=Nocardioides deserti TaxID=1588644 RepID=A0ABR6UB19_9ACTN|nr:hypothetical protein [Nocardioides deserti]MBC2961323.1 hypothetical protein [Nocardioides deserti]GGO72405.1 hypothetical protein GCM10012276_15690 [Nocardioides deserti]
MDYYAQQVFQMRNVPNLSIADNQFMDHWEERARSDDRHYVKKQAAERRERDRAKAADVLRRIDGLQEAFVDLRRKAERNEVSWTDLAKAQRRLVRERITLEKVLESLQSSEAGIARMEADPTAYLSDFYQRFPALKDRRPNLAVDLAEDQRKRGVESLM